MATTHQMSICLWFDKNGEEAANFYLSVFKNSRKLRTTHYSKEGQEQHKMPDGSVMTVEFELNGMKFLALNAGPAFKFNEAVSVIVTCDTQEEVDHYWNKLSEGGDPKAQVCGWLKDKYGLSWQITPKILDELMYKEDGAKERPIMKAMMEMKKIDIKKLEEAAKK